ncbi:MAG: hypothetical protein WCO19_04975 [Candidatus Saccharibacteria bacterium]
MTEKRKSVMVIPRCRDKILLQSFKNSNGDLVWDGFGNFYQDNEDPESTAEAVFSEHFKTELPPDLLKVRAQLNYLINKPDGLVDLDVTAYFADVDEDLSLPEHTNWFPIDAIPYSKMHVATGKWLPIILKKSSLLKAEIRVEQPGDHTKGIVTEFNLK